MSPRGLGQPFLPGRVGCRGKRKSDGLSVKGVSPLPAGEGKGLGLGFWCRELFFFDLAVHVFSLRRVFLAKGRTCSWGLFNLSA